MALVVSSRARQARPPIPHQPTDNQTHAPPFLTHLPMLAKAFSSLHPHALSASSLFYHLGSPWSNSLRASRVPVVASPPALHNISPWLAIFPLGPITRLHCAFWLHITALALQSRLPRPIWPSSTLTTPSTACIAPAGHPCVLRLNLPEPSRPNLPE